MCHLHSDACAIPESETVVITGGRDTETTVSRYDDTKWMEDLPPLNIGRYLHACAGYTLGGRKVRLNYEKQEICILKSVEDAPCYRRLGT